MALPPPVVLVLGGLQERHRANAPAEVATHRVPLILPLVVHPAVAEGLHVLGVLRALPLLLEGELQVARAIEVELILLRDEEPLTPQRIVRLCRGRGAQRGAVLPKCEPHVPS